MADFSEFDTRGYRTVDVRTGYAEWVPTYEDTVQDAMDIALLDELRSVDWSGGARPTSAAAPAAPRPGCAPTASSASTAST